jgi:outer membrane receptor protein involved in Fe transport
MHHLLRPIGVFLLAVSCPLAFGQAVETGQGSSEIVLRGRVTDATTGEPIAKVKVRVIGVEQSSVTDGNGDFALRGLAPGEIELYVTTIGYGLVKKKVLLKTGEEINLSIALNQEAATLREEITVNADPFAEPETNVVSSQTLDKAELRTLSTVLVSDPVRAAQSLPGVVANDDFRTDFALRGAGIKRTGFYLDGLLLPENPVHTKAGDADAGQISILNADTIAGVSLLSGAFPAKYGDATGGVLELDTRDGNRARAAGRIAASLLSSSATFDAPFASKHGTWLVSARKSYLGYLVGLLGDHDPGTERFVVGFTDGIGKVIYDLSERHQVGLTAVWGLSSLESNLSDIELSPNDVKRSESSQWIVFGSWNFTASPRFYSKTRAFGLRGHFLNDNRADQALQESEYEEAGIRSDINYLAPASHHIEAGVYLRLPRGTDAERLYSPAPITLVEFERDSNEQGYYVQDTWSSKRLRAALTGGVRLDRFGLTGETVVTPRVALSVAPRESVRVRLGWGKHAQFPGFAELFAIRGNPNLRAERSTHYDASVEYLLRENTRLVVELYDREDMDLFFSLAESFIKSGQLAFISFPFRNSLRGHARGIELTLHRRSANRLTGWISYSNCRTRLTDNVTGLSFVSDFDQGHTVSAFGSYRLTNTLNLSAQWRYGSGLPFVGFFQESNGQVVLGSERNRLRLPAYSRVDVRVNKAFHFKRSKLTLSGEVLNLLGRENVRQDGRGTEKLLPLVPSIGIAFEF